MNVLYNLGMALSDAGKLAKAEEPLRRAVELAPQFVNAVVALGVALSRQQKNDEAATFLESAVALEPENPWAQQNLGGVLLKQSRFAEAADHLLRAVTLQPDGQMTWVGLGDALRLAGRAKDAENAYGQAIALNPHNDAAEAARRGSSQLAQGLFEAKAQGAPRPDAVQYCLAALTRFAQMQRQQIQEITFEIAMVGRNGFDLNTPTKKYTLKTMAGEFSGLQMVCYMYAGFQVTAPGTNMGFDLAREYQTAKELFGKPG